MAYMEYEDLNEKIRTIREKVEDIDEVEDIIINDDGYGWISCQISFSAQKKVR